MKPFLFMLALSVSSLAVTTDSQAAIARNCDNNAIVFCGAETQSELMQKISGGDGRNSSENISQILVASGVDINQISQTVEGSVNKDGTVMVNGTLVATGAMSVGRQFIAGSTQQGSVWIRPTSVSFRSDSLPAFVAMQDGRFAWAVIKSCGNPVVANSVMPARVRPVPVAAAVTPPPPAPTPRPAATTPLPTTGSGLAVGSVLGLGLLYGALKWYFSSRGQLKAALMSADILKSLNEKIVL